MILFFLLPVTAAVTRDLVYEACIRNSSLAFCDSHVFGKLATSTVTPDDQETKEMLFLLAGFKDDVDDEDGEELENARRVHTDVNEYCSKYANNYKNYCEANRGESLEGVLPQFCGSYQKACGVESVVKVGSAHEESFPEPPTLEKTFHVDPKKTARNSGERYRRESSSKTEEYCKQFQSEFDSLCGSSPGKDAVEFCNSFKENCKNSGSSKAEGFVEENEPVSEGEGSETSSRVLQYCEQYSENYNFYCVGESSGNNEKFCNSYRKNCPDKVGSFKESGSFLGEKGGGSSDSGGRSGVYSFRGTKKDYCERFAVNYEYYCKGDSTDPQITVKFCPVYKENCLLPTTTTPRPANPFEEFPDLDHPGGKKHRRKGKKKAVKKKKRACTADCNQKIHPHCTPDCKCDYAYPYVQKFCNPPPLPLFLNTCRLWYNGCPKYERYHYASQFIYSKAEKGKKIEGPINTQPFSVLSPTGERIPVNVRQPGVGNQRRKDYVLWESDNDTQPIDNREIHKTDYVLWESANETQRIPSAEDKNTRKKDEVLSESPNKAQSVPIQKRKNGNLRVFDLPGVRDLPPGVKEIVPDIGIFGPKRKKDVPAVPKDQKAKDAVPVVPSDSVFQNAVSQYGAFTDNSGILHRPRSRSPFTKPGLWEPNPDDPHNRDHANKWYYAPKSVNVDWLNGQLAWGAHWAVPAAGVGGTDGFSAVHFPTIGTFLNIPDDYD